MLEIYFSYLLLFTVQAFDAENSSTNATLALVAPDDKNKPESTELLNDPFTSGLNVGMTKDPSNDLQLYEGIGMIRAPENNSQFQFDVTERAAYDSNREEWSFTQYYGFDFIKTLTNNTGDYATLVLQGGLTRIINNPSPPFFFDGPTDSQWTYRMFYINLKLAKQDSLNLKIGRFEMPFGLEMTNNTNGTLRQFGTAQNLGIKGDWGLTLNGVSRGLEYEFGISRGSNQSWKTSGSPYAFVARVGTDSTVGSWVGVSAFDAKLYRPGTTIERNRIGVDAGIEFDAYTLMGEFSIGENESNDAMHGLIELNWRNPAENWFAYGQVRMQKQQTSANGWQGPLQSALGIKYNSNQNWTLSAELVQNLEKTSSGSRDTSISFQMRYLF